MSRSDLGPTQPCIQWVPRVLSLGVKRPGREADHSPASSAEVHRATPQLPQCASTAWCSVKEKHRDNFTFTFYDDCFSYMNEVWLSSATREHVQKCASEPTWINTCLSLPQITISYARFEAFMAMKIQVEIWRLTAVKIQVEICGFHGGENSSRALSLSRRWRFKSRFEFFTMVKI